MPGIGPTELLVILVIVIIVFGAGKLPELGSGLGKAMREFKKTKSEITDIKESITDAGPLAEVKAEVAGIRNSIKGLNPIAEVKAEVDDIKKSIKEIDPLDGLRAKQESKSEKS